MKFSFRPKILDIVALLLGISAILLVSLSVYSNSGDVSYVYITGEKGEWIEPLGTNKEIDVAGPIGSTHVHIENGSVAITDSPCENKICVGMGAISQKNQWVACLPNSVFVRIAGLADGEALDAAAY